MLMLVLFCNSAGAPAPNAVMEQLTRWECSSPSCLAVAGSWSSMTASAPASSSRTAAESRVTDRLLVFRYANSPLRSGSDPMSSRGAMARVGLPRPGRSTLMTSAPRAASSLPQTSRSALRMVRAPGGVDASGLGAGLGAPRPLQPPLRREVHVVVLHHVVQ